MFALPQVFLQYQKLSQYPHRIRLIMTGLTFSTDSQIRHKENMGRKACFKQGMTLLHSPPPTSYSILPIFLSHLQSANLFPKFLEVCMSLTRISPPTLHLNNNFQVCKSNKIHKLKNTENCLLTQSLLLQKCRSKGKYFSMSSCLHSICNNTGNTTSKAFTLIVNRY